MRDALPDGPVVVTLTGHGLKDPDIALTAIPEIEAIPATMDALLERLSW